jgi:hypothetical protein
MSEHDSSLQYGSCRVCGCAVTRNGQGLWRHTEVPVGGFGVAHFAFPKVAA